MTAGSHDATDYGHRFLLLLVGVALGDLVEGAGMGLVALALWWSMLTAELGRSAALALGPLI